MAVIGAAAVAALTAVAIGRAAAGAASTAFVLAAAGDGAGAAGGATASAAGTAVALPGRAGVAAVAALDGAVVGDGTLQRNHRLAAVTAIAACAYIGVLRVAARTAVAAGDGAALRDGCRLVVADQNAVAALTAVAGGLGLGGRAVAAVAAGDAAAVGHGDCDGASDTRAAVTAVKRTGRVGVGGCAVRAVAAEDVSAVAHGDFSVFGDLALIVDRVVQRVNARRAVGIGNAAAAALNGAVGDGEVGAGMVRPFVLHKAQTGSLGGCDGLAIEIQRHVLPGVGDGHGVVNDRAVLQLDLVAVGVARAGVHRDGCLVVERLLGLVGVAGCGFAVSVLKGSGHVGGVHQHGFRGHAVCVGGVFDVVPGVLIQSLRRADAVGACRHRGFFHLTDRVDDLIGRVVYALEGQGVARFAEDIQAAFADLYVHLDAQARDAALIDREGQGFFMIAHVQLFQRVQAEHLDMLHGDRLAVLVIGLYVGGLLHAVLRGSRQLRAADVQVVRCDHAAAGAFDHLTVLAAEEGLEDQVLGDLGEFGVDLVDVVGRAVDPADKLLSRSLHSVFDGRRGLVKQSFGDRSTVHHILFGVR